jgi:hypothetical protein
VAVGLVVRTLAMVELVAVVLVVSVVQEPLAVLTLVEAVGQQVAVLPVLLPVVAVPVLSSSLSEQEQALPFLQV